MNRAGGGQLADEGLAGVPASRIDPDTATPWRILIVDADADVHMATELTLQDAGILGRRLQFLNAFDETEALDLMARERDIAVLLVSVAGEREAASLDLVRAVRDALGIADTRIILRADQATRLPEIDVIRDYDINDYKTKGELTRHKLYTTLATAIRSYAQIRALDANRRGLEHIVQSSIALMAERSLASFAAAVLRQLANLLGQQGDGLVCGQMRIAGDLEGQAVMAATGRYAAALNKPLVQLGEAAERAALLQVISQKRNHYDDGHAIVYLGSDTRGAMAACMDLERPLYCIDQKMLEVFASNIAMCADNLALVQRLRNAAYVDALLQLPNRLAFLEAVGDALQDGRRNTHAVVLVDIDQFAELNDALGQRHGDLLLRAVSARLQGQFRDRAVIARVGGDIFGLLLPRDLTQSDQLLGSFRNFFDLEGVEQRVMATAGVVALTDVEGKRGSDALKDASLILKRAKQDQRGEVAYFQRSMVAEARERLRLLQMLRVALDDDQLFLIYQPQLELASGRVVGLEALIRWRQADGELIPPDRFIPLAEQSGMIVWVGEWVLRTAARQLQGLRQLGWTDLRVAVNVSVIQLRQPEFLDSLIRALHDFQIPPQLMELEITESVAMGDFGANLAVLEQIRQLGVALAIDDFGTGYSSLGYLENLPVNRLKIDRSFVRRMEDSDASDIIRLVIQLGHTLGLTVVAEGVEQAASAQRLRQLGCHEVQGYLYSPPLPAEELVAWLGSHGGGGTAVD